MPDRPAAEKDRLCQTSPGGDPECAKCGTCATVCPVFRVSGRESLTARGRLHLLGRLASASSPLYGDIFSQCLLCGACADACPRQIDTRHRIIGAREEIPWRYDRHFPERLLTAKALSSPLCLSGLAGLVKILAGRLPPESGLWQKLPLLPADFPPPPAGKDRGPGETGGPAASYFSGCLAHYLDPGIGRATRTLLSRLGGRGLLVPEDQNCCGLAAFGAGRREEARRLARKNIAAFAGHDLPILTSCASCYHHLKGYGTLLADDPDWAGPAEDFSRRLREFSRFFLELLPAGKPAGISRENRSAQRVFHHDPCHLRFGPGRDLTSPRKLIEAFTGRPLLEAANGPQCCGQGGLFHLIHPELSKKIFTRALTEVKELSPNLIVTSCSGCLLQWQKGVRQAGLACQVRHPALFLASFFGPEAPPGK